MDEMVQSFLMGCPTAPARDEPVTTLAAPTFEPMVIGDDLYTGTAYALNRASEGLDIAVAASGRGEGDFEPMVVGDDLYEGVAYSLNRASEGLNLASEGFTSRSPAEASRVSQLSVALRLTREAVYAWSNLLHGPAVVAISR